MAAKTTKKKTAKKVTIAGVKQELTALRKTVMKEATALKKMAAKDAAVLRKKRNYFLLVIQGCNFFFATFFLVIFSLMLRMPSSMQQP